MKQAHRRAATAVLGLPLIRNVKTVDPSDPSTPEVIQIETAMGAAIEIFEGARSSRSAETGSCPVKTTNDLLVLRSDVYDLGSDFVLDQRADELPYVELDGDSTSSSSEFDQPLPRGRPVAARGRRRSASRATGPSAATCRSSAT